MSDPSPSQPSRGPQSAPEKGRRKARSWRWVGKWLRRGLMSYAFFLIVIVLLENRLVYPAPAGGFSPIGEEGAQSFRFESADGTALHGHFYEVPEPKFTLVFFHGNAETVATSGSWLRSFGKRMNANAMMFDYRGYGESAGRAHEAGVVADGQAAVQWLEERTGQESSAFVYLGRSLGGAVAVQVARKYPPRALVLVSTFSSLVEVAQDHFPWIPVRFVMRNRFDSEEVMRELDVPLLQIHGDKDAIVPLQWGRKLFEASATPHKDWATAKGRGHNDLYIDLFDIRMQQFLREAPGGEHFQALEAR